jgi:putative transposase
MSGPGSAASSTSTNAQHDNRSTSETPRGPSEPGLAGQSLDNAVAESWFASLKVELVDRAHYRTCAEARAAIFGWIAWYNRFRLHSARDYLPSVEWEQQHATINSLPSSMAA